MMKSDIFGYAQIPRRVAGPPQSRTGIQSTDYKREEKDHKHDPAFDPA
jgi:hypothetical protein